MSTEVLPAAYLTDARPVMGTPHRALESQQAAVVDRDRLLRKAQANGQRLVSALYLVLDRHAAEAVVTDHGRVHLTCVECRPQGRAAVEQYPCPTARQAMWALDAVLG